MFKKMSFASAALAGAVLFGGAFQTTASAEGNQNQSDGYTYKVYYSVNGFCDSLSDQKIQDVVNKYFHDYKMNWKQFDWAQQDQEKKEQTPDTEKPAMNEQPEKEKPQAEQPAEENQKPAEQPEQQEQVEQPEQAPAPAPAENKQPQQEQQQPAQEQGYQLNQFEKQVVELTNQERAQQGLAPLQVSVELSKVAREKSKDMARNNYFSHNSPTYGSPFDMMNQFGISYRTAGENIAKGQRTPQEVVNAWMNSPGHRKNIMNPDFTHIGVGYVAEGNIWTQQFIGK